jgi:hypothetical protein
MRFVAFILLVGILFSCENARDGSSKKWKFALVSPNYSNIHFNNRIQESESLNVLQNISLNQDLQDFEDYS